MCCINQRFTYYCFWWYQKQFLFTKPSAHDALILFKASFSVPKMMHMLCCSPCTEHPSLQEIYNVLRKGICAVANLDLTDLQWLQASHLSRTAGWVYVMLPRWHLLLFRNFPDLEKFGFWKMTTGMEKSGKILENCEAYLENLGFHYAGDYLSLIHI